MAIEKFRLESLATIDGGRIKEAFEQAFARLVADCHDRPDLKAARKLGLIVIVEPISDGGTLNSIDVNFEMKDSLPKRESRSYNMALDQGGHVVFNELSPEEIRQRTLDMASPGPRAVKGGQTDAV
jgi:hypothetical protein